ncbi:MAG: outer membrane protein [Betaproteobacteria bacterium]
MRIRTMRLAAAAACLVLAAATPARAAGYITPFWGFNFGGDSANCISLTNCEEKRTNLGVSFGSTGALFGFEADFGYAKDFFGKAPGADTSVLTFTTNLTVTLPLGPVRPYLLGGIGLIRPHASLSLSQLSLDKNAFGYDIGGGVNVLATRHLGVRGDLRRFRTLQDVTLFVFTGDKLEFWRGSVGLVLQF